MQQLLGLLARLDGPGYRNHEDRADAVRQLRSLGFASLRDALAKLLVESDLETRCQASLAAVFIDRIQGIALILPLLEDCASTVRGHVCGLLHDVGDERAVDPLIARLKIDSDPQVRGTAAFALGGIGTPKAIPALIETLDADHEVDQLGFSPSFCAAGALDDILGTNQTRLKLSSSLCTLPGKKPDLATLRQLALEVYQIWRSHHPCEHDDKGPIS